MLTLICQLASRSSTILLHVGMILVATLAGIATTPAEDAIVTIAGGGLASDPQHAGIGFPAALAIAADGTLFWSTGSTIMHRLANGTLAVVAGNGGQGFAGDGGAATAALLSGITSMAIDAQGDLFISDGTNQRIRKVTAATGLITTVAGGGASVLDGVAATSARLGFPMGIALDAAGDIFIADVNDHRVRRVDAITGFISTVAGNGTAPVGGAIGDHGPATGATLSQPTAVAVDAAGNLYVADQGIPTVRFVAMATGTITTIAGNGTQGFSGDGAAATAAALSVPRALLVTGAGDVLISDLGNNRVRRVAAAGGVITTIAGNGGTVYNGDGIAATAATLHNPLGLAVDGSGNLFIADESHSRIRMVATGTGLISTVAGNGAVGYSGDGALATTTQFSRLGGMAFGPSGDLYVVEQGDNRICRISATTGIVSTVAGTGVYGFSGDGGPATAAQLANPVRIAFTNAGELIFADQDNNRIRKIAVNGTITTIVGSGHSAADLDRSGGFSGDGGQATAATLNQPVGLYISGNGDLLITDLRNQRVRRIDALTGVISTIAGNSVPGDNGGFAGDGGLATNALLNNPVDVIADPAGNIFIAEFSNRRVRRIAVADGTIATFAGNGIAAITTAVGDGGQALAANLGNPTALLLDAQGNLLVSVTGNDAIRRIDHATGIISTIAGSSVPGLSGDGGIATLARLNRPTTTCLAPDGRLIISDGDNNRIRALIPRTVPVITWVPAGLVYGTPLGAAQLDATASVAGSFVYSPVAGTGLDAGVHVLSTTFTPTDTVSHPTVTATASVTVSQAPLVLVADALQRVEGAANPTFTFHAVGLVNGDTLAVLSHSPILSTTANTASVPGSYAITIDLGGVSASNYAITATTGVLTVTSASVSGPTPPAAGGGGAGGSHCGMGGATAMLLFALGLMLVRMRPGRTD